MSNIHVETLGRPVAARGLANPLKGLYAALVGWQQRYELRQHLLEMDDRLLDDIGLDRAKARLEAAKPFWKD